MTTESLPPAAGAEHLTAAFRRAGVLSDACITEVAVESTRDTVVSRITRLRLSYDRPTGAPASVILKTGHHERADATWTAGRQEVAFYTQIATAMPSLLLPRCFDADWNADTNAWHIVLEDLTETHKLATQWPLPPTMPQCEAIMRVRARFHAAWWDDPRLGASIGSVPDVDAGIQRMQVFAEKFAGFTDRVGDCLPRERRELFERLIDAAPRLIRHYATRRNLTIIQGDSHVWNCFLPNDAGSDDARLFDWDSWRIAGGSHDLAYMMAMHWYPDIRREREQRLLDHYHATLLAHGVTGYDRRALDDDYRQSVLWQITTPVWQEVYDIPSWIWWNNLGRILLAVDDLGCRDLLE